MLGLLVWGWWLLPERLRLHPAGAQMNSINHIMNARR
jgi:hypothetical protein